jgi:aerobic-type carbon monoxide dehydrogenase small subunit (CoxS/CutS family)
MILATVALLRETPQPTEEQIRTGLDRHVCRCGAYPKVVKAVRRAATQAGR